MADPQTDISTLGFEEALAELEAIVKKLESGAVRLDDAIAAYERGARLKEHCEARLKQAQARVERIVLGADGSVAVQPAAVE